MCVWERHVENNRGREKTGLKCGMDALANSLTIFVEPN